MTYNNILTLKSHYTSTTVQHSLRDSFSVYHAQKTWMHPENNDLRTCPTLYAKAGGSALRHRAKTKQYECNHNHEVAPASSSPRHRDIHWQRNRAIAAARPPANDPAIMKEGCCLFPT